MNEYCPDHRITITAANRALMQCGLNHTVRVPRQLAIAEGLRGIPVTHEAPGRFMGAVNGNVPFGLTRENQT